MQKRGALVFEDNASAPSGFGFLTNGVALFRQHSLPWSTIPNQSSESLKIEARNSKPGMDVNNKAPGSCCSKVLREVF